MKRLWFTIVLIAMLIWPTVALARDTRSATGSPTPTPPPSQEQEFQIYTNFEGVDRATTIMFSNVKETSLFSEPLALTFVAYEFSDAGTASAAMPAICDFTETNHEILADSKYSRTVSIGRIGEDRCAFGVDFPGEASTLAVAIRVENQVLTVLAIGLDGDYPEFVGSFLEGFLEDVEGVDRSILPELADMPRGWEEVTGVRDITDELITLATPAP